MGNYSMEYKTYYEGLKNKSSARGNSSYSRVEDYLPDKGELYGYRSKKSQGGNVLNYITSMFTIQLVGTIIMFLFVFGAKYSDNAQLDKYYDYLKAEINKKVTYSDVKKDVEAFKVSDVVDEIKDSVKWIKDKMESNPLN